MKRVHIVMMLRILMTANNISPVTSCGIEYNVNFCQ